jgi:hypothetical protein
MKTPEKQQPPLPEKIKIKQNKKTTKKKTTIIL